MIVQRYYSYNYWAMFAHSFGEGSTVQNEQGYYLGLETSPFRHWHFFASFDLFSFPWKKYRISQPSHGVDGLFQATFTPHSHLTMYLKYRYKQKERDLTDSKEKLTLPIFHHQLRYRLNYFGGDVFSSRTTLDYNHFHSQDRAASKGYQVTQMISSQLLGPGCLLTFKAVIFLQTIMTRVFMYQRKDCFIHFTLRPSRGVDSVVPSV